MNLESIQSELQKAGLDGWLFFDHHKRDPLAYRVLGLKPPGHVGRRWYYFRVQENRVSMIPGSVAELVKRGHHVIVQRGAGEGASYHDELYTAVGAEIVADAAAVFAAAELIVKVKEPQVSEVALLKPHHILFTYLHLAADLALTESLAATGCTAIAYETIEVHRRLPLLEPMSEIAGRMSAIVGSYHLAKHRGGRGCLLGGVPGVAPGRVVVLGGGTAGVNAARVATGIGADVTIIDVDFERMRFLDITLSGTSMVYSNEANLSELLPRVDLVIGAVLVPGAKAPKLITREMLRMMPRGSVFVDSAVGWPIIFFLDYDFAKNPLQIMDSTLEALQRNTDRFRELKYADSFTVDFQKWGYVPYTSSLVMVKDRASMKFLEHDPKNFSYFEKDVQGQTHLQGTIECSRGAAGLFGAYAALQALGMEGYQTLIAHGLQNVHYFRCRLDESPGAAVVAAANGGPSVGFRLYDPQQVKDPAAELALEKAAMTTTACRARLTRNTAYHRAVFLARGKAGLYTNWIQYVTHTAYDDKGAWNPIPGEKAVFFNPHTEQEHIDTFVARLHGAPGI